jgi:hypothetical protein
MAAAGARAACRREGAQSRDLRPARQAADRLGQRPADDRPHRAAVDVVAPGAVLRHIAAAAARRLTWVCKHHNVAWPRSRARLRIGRTRTEHARRAGAVGCAAPLPRADRDRVYVACRPEPNVSSKRIRRVQGAAQHPAHVILHSVHEDVSSLVQHQSGTGRGALSV